MAFENATNDPVDQINKLADKITEIPDCSALEELIKEITDMIKLQLEAMLEELARQAEIAIPPTSLKKLIKWAKKIAGGAYAKYIALVELYAKTVAAFTKLLNAIQAKLALLDCRNVKLPTLDSIIPSIPETGIFLQVKNAWSIAQLVQSPGALLSNAGSLLDNAQAAATALDVNLTANTAAAAELAEAVTPAVASATGVEASQDKV
jgi:hypothetical protein